MDSIRVLTWLWLDWMQQLGPPRAYGHYVVPSAADPQPTPAMQMNAPQFTYGTATAFEDPSNGGNAFYQSSNSAIGDVKSAGESKGEVLDWFLD